MMSYTKPLVADSHWIFSRFRSNIPLHLIMSHFLMILSSPHFEHGCYTCLLTDALASSLGPRSWKGTHILSFTQYGRYSWLSVHGVLTSTTPVLPALSDFSLRPRHTQPSGVNAQCPATQPWFAFRTAVSLHVPSHLGSLAQCTHCHFVMQARALRVPVLCDDHTPPSCLVAYPLAKMGHRSVSTLVLPDPWLTQGGLVTFLACALHQLFARSCDLAHHGLYCSHVCACIHHSLLQHLSLVFAFVIFSSHMEEQQNVRLPLGTTE